MNSEIELLQHQHRRLDRIIDTYRNGLVPHRVRALKRLRLKLRDRIAGLQRTLQS